MSQQSGEERRSALNTAESMEKRLGRVELVQEAQGRRIDAIDDRTMQMNNKLDDLIAFEHSKPQVKTFEHYVRVVLSTLLTAGLLIGALDYYVSGKIEKQTASLQHDASSLKSDVSSIAAAIQWKPALKDWVSR